MRIWERGATRYGPENDANRADSRGTPSRPSRGNLGRRRSDYDSRTNLNRKVVTVIIVVVDALYLLGESLLAGGTSCL